MRSISYLRDGEIKVPQELVAASLSLARIAASAPADSPAALPAKVLDLRSDVVTPPTEEMWEAMRQAGFSGTPVDDDAIVKELEELGAALVGKQAGLFVPTCTVANLLALMTLGERGTKVVLEKTSHIATSEEWGLAYICGLVPHLVEGKSGAMSAAQLRGAMSRERSSQRLRTCLLCLENSHTNSGGVALSERETRELVQVAKHYGAAVHLDGARLFNAAVALDVAPRQLAEAADTVAISLNKGLSAPMGALLCSTEETIALARINARRIGAASIHKAGTLAAAGIVALNNRDHLTDDNRKAAVLAELLCQAGGLQIDRETVQTNLVKAHLVDSGLSAREFVEGLALRGVLALERDRQEVRFVLHRSISEDDVRFIAAAAAAVLSC